MAGRGQITPELEVMAKEKLGITLTVRSLRLLPYMQYVLMNGGQLNRRSVNDDERALLDHWDDLGLIRIHQGFSREAPSFRAGRMSRADRQGNKTLLGWDERDPVGGLC